MTFVEHNNREKAKKFADWLSKTNMALGCKDESAF